MSENDIIISRLDSEIIEYLISCHDYCDSYDIARTVGINRRQVRSEIANVKEILSSLGFTLDSKRSKGYRILERDKIFDLQDMLHNMTSETQSVYTPDGRRNYLTEILASNDTGYIKLDDIANALYVSRSTINNDLQSLNERFTSHGLVIEAKPRYGIRITGSERDKRNILCDTIYNFYTTGNSHVDFLELFMNPESTLEYSIMNILQNQDIVMSDMALSDFLVYLTVVCMRVSAGKMLEESEDVSSIRNRREYDTANLLGVRISQYLGILLNEHEINQIAVKIVTNQSSTIAHEHEYHALTPVILEECIERIRTETGISMGDPVYIEQFKNYIDSALTILSFHEKVRNPYYSTIRETYPLAYDLTTIVSEVFRQCADYHLSSSFMAYFTVFFNTWIQDKRFRRRRVLLISALGIGAANSITKELEFNFGRYLKVVNIGSYHDLPNIDMDDYDMVVSTTPLPRHLTIPSVVISQFMTNDDLQKIETVISSDYSVFYPELEYFPSLYVSGLRPKSPEDLHKVMADMICRLFPKLKTSYVDTTLRSKQNYITDLGNGFLFVRLEKPLNKQRFAAAALLNKPLLYEDSSIRAVIVVSSDNRTYYRALREASRIIPRKELEEAADKKNPAYAEFIQLYKEE